MNIVTIHTSAKRRVPTCSDVNPSGIHRFTASPIISTLKRYNTLKHKVGDYDVAKSVKFLTFKTRRTVSKYIVAFGVTHSPHDWTGFTDLEKRYDNHQMERATIFHYLPPKILGDLRKGKCFLLLDQTHEGYHTDWLFDWFHDSAETYNIPVKQIIYVTGNLNVKDQYRLWCTHNAKTECMLVIPHIQFDEFIWDSARKEHSRLLTVDQHIEYKQANADKLKTYNCFQKRNRPHRVWMFHSLYKNNLLDNGINSMNSFQIAHSFYEGRSMSEQDYNEIIPLLPMYPRPTLNDSLKSDFEGPLGGSFERDLYIQETKDSWVSVVSEASFAEDTCFISEKTFKPIATRHPFIMYGNKHSLRCLHELGYKTFDGFIDESYDSMETWPRLNAVIQEIEKINELSFSQKIEWLTGMKEILDHNYKMLEYNSTGQAPDAYIKIEEYVGE